MKKVLLETPKPCLIMGDFNAHHILFGCQTNNNRGNSLYALIDDFDLCILNDGDTATTVQYPNRNQSAIDLALVSSALAPLCEWHVHDDPMGSYHYPTVVALNVKPSVYEVRPAEEKYIYNKADWSKYQELSETRFCNLEIHGTEPIDLYNNFVNILYDIRAETVPKQTPQQTLRVMRKPAPWWNQTCDDAVRKSKEALKEYRKSPSIPNFINYKKLDAQKKRILKEESINSWHNLCTSFNRMTPISRIWNYMKRFRRIGSSHNRYLADDWIPSFLDNITDSSQLNEDYLNDILDQSVENESNSFLNRPFTLNELYIALKSRKDTTPGLDSIPYMLIKKLHPNAQEMLLNIYNKLWNNLAIPKSWKTQCVIPILKPNKAANDPSSYRPISLTSCLGKLFENMLKLRLDYFAETQDKLPHIQFGFRKGRSCSESFVSLISELKKAKLSHSNVICVFLDVKGAFDNVNIECLIKVLHELNLPRNVLIWILNFLHDRTLFVKFNNKLHGPRPVNKGTMQGATLSPLLYNLYTSQILKYVDTSQVKILQFADDLLLYSENQNINTAINRINTALAQLHLYYSNILKLEISSEKSKVLVFSKDTFVNSGIKINYNNDTIPIANHHKFLGVVLDDKLKFDKHINYICQNAMKSINVLRSLAGTFWGSDPKTLSMLYKSIVRSHFDYSSLAYMNISSTLLRKLDVIQNMGLRIISGAMRTTPIVSMEVENCIPPLSLRRLQLAERFCLKELSCNNDIVLSNILYPAEVSQLNGTANISANTLISGTLPEITTITTCVKNQTRDMYISNKWPIYKCPYDTLLNYLDIKCHLNSVSTKNEFLEFLNEKKDFYTIYTDGSKSDLVKAAFYDPQMKVIKCIKLPSNCSIFTAESWAILAALSYVNTNVNSVNILIVSDSKSVLSALCNCNLVYKQNYILYKIKDKLQTIGKCIEFLWVPSHSGIVGNEIVDQATRQDHHEDQTQDCKVPFTDYYQHFKILSKKLWKDYWNITTVNKGKWYAELQPDLPTIPWYNRFKYTGRKFITTINRLRFGHCLVPAHLYRMKIVADDKCTHCAQHNADINHIIFQCPSFGIQRLTLVSEISDVAEENSISVPRRVQDLLTDVAFFMPLFKFILNTVGKL
ncbi:unnamed protein product [Parnassius mnemosyne]|uniref:Uncharacterized protein n=1 Tax=Parnassius mnemosyne TaxID=213953 RepID=A0AAV1KGW8_9NEOP